MGIFGFLSKAHIDQTINLNTGVADQIQILKSKISFEKQSIEDLDKQRCKTHYLNDMIEDLEWIGIKWDEGYNYNYKT